MYPFTKMHNQKKLNKKTPNKLGKRRNNNSSNSNRNDGKMKMVNWLEMPPDMMVEIIRRVGAIEIILDVQKVCRAWYKLCKDYPAMWREIFMDYASIENRFGRSMTMGEATRKLCKDAIDRSQGQLVDITMLEFWDDDLLCYVADRSNQLKRLEIGFYGEFKSIDRSEFWTQVLKKLPLLEEFSVYKTDIPTEIIATLGSYCPMLKTLELNDTCPPVNDEVAIAIGGTLPELQHLELTWSSVSNIGLQAILDGCLHLQSLDLRLSYPVDLEGELGKRCARQIKYLLRPDDPINRFRYGEFG